MQLLFQYAPRIHILSMVYFLKVIQYNQFVQGVCDAFAEDYDVSVQEIYKAALV